MPISNSQSSGVVTQGDLVTTLDRLGEGRVGGNYHKGRQNVLQILVGMDGEVRVVPLSFPERFTRNIYQDIRAFQQLPDQERLVRVGND